MLIVFEVAGAVHLLSESLSGDRDGQGDWSMSEHWREQYTRLIELLIG